MSSSEEDKRKRRTLVLRPSSRALRTSGIHQSTIGSGEATPSRKSFSLGGGSKVLEKSIIHNPRQAVRVFDKDGNDVTPQPLFQEDPAAVQVKGSKCILDDISAGTASEQTTATGSFTMPFFRSLFGSSRISSQSTIDSLNEEIEDTFSKRDLPINVPDSQGKRDTVKEEVTEEMLKEVVDIYITETDTISLLDIPSILVSVDAEDAEAVVERNNQYAEVCKNRMGNDKYVDRYMQTFNGALKNKQIQSDSTVMVDAATMVTNWDIYAAVTSPEQDETMCSPEPERLNQTETVDAGTSGERSTSLSSTISSASATSSMKELEAFGGNVNSESDLKLIMSSEKFQEILMVIERTVVGNIFQPRLSTYKQLPVLPEPGCPMESGWVEQMEKQAESGGPPAVACLWSFNCELTRGRCISGMAWNKRIPDFLAVGYGESDCSEEEKGLVCCWSVKNPTWPERVIHCDSPVTSLDFSSDYPSQLAVGMHNGNIAVYNVYSKACIIDNRGCSNKHLAQVWQVRWVQQELTLSGEERVESLFSVAGDGRVCKWFVAKRGLDSKDVMKLQKNKGKTGYTLSALVPGLCLDFNPKEPVYLVGTWDGPIHKCACGDSIRRMETYKKHLCPVNAVAWCPHNPDFFLSCSDDWTIQLWRQDSLRPVLSFNRTQTSVYHIQWSPQRATVFAAATEDALEIWDLSCSILKPVIVQPAAPGVKMKSLLFSPQCNCVLVGDSAGEVTVYQLLRLAVADDSQVDSLEAVVRSAASRKEEQKREEPQRREPQREEPQRQEPITLLDLRASVTSPRIQHPD